MIYEFARLSLDKKQVIQVVNRGGKYDGIRLDIDAPDSYYIDDLGLIPIESPILQYDEDKQTYSVSYDITPELVTRVYTIKELSLEEKSKIIIDRVETLLNNEARAVGYDSILSACSYAGYPNPFQAEGQNFTEWRGNVWAKCYQILGEVEAGTRAEPTVLELLAELPARVAP